MSANSIDEDIGELCRLLNESEGLNVLSARPGDPKRGRFQGYVCLQTSGPEATRKLLGKLGRKFATVFHVGEQKCEMGFRVEVGSLDHELRYYLRFWGCPEWGMQRIRRVLTERIAGERDRDKLPSLTPPDPDGGT